MVSSLSDEHGRSVDDNMPCQDVFLSFAIVSPSHDQHGAVLEGGHRILCIIHYSESFNGNRCDFLLACLGME